ncbi:MAG: SHOCT domain-containing protein [Burkholderiales bacterium]
MKTQIRNLAISISALWVSPLLAHFPGDETWAGYGMMGGFGPGFGVMHMLLWLGLIVLGIAVLAKWLSGKSKWCSHGPSDDRAVAILRERYARGEIAKDEFDNRKRDLS